VSEAEGKYSIELFKEGGEGAGQDEILDRHDNLTVARAIYRGRVQQYPGRLGHAVRPGEDFGEERPAGNDALTLWRRFVCCRFLALCHSDQSAVSALIFAPDSSGLPRPRT
jgi:hypothetical protein